MRHKTTVVNVLSIFYLFTQHNIILYAIGMDVTNILLLDIMVSLISLLTAR